MIFRLISMYSVCSTCVSHCDAFDFTFVAQHNIENTHTHTHSLTHTLSLTSFLLFLLQRQKCKGKQSFEEEMKKEKKKDIIDYIISLFVKSRKFSLKSFFSYNVSTSIISPLFFPLNTFNTVTCYNTAFFFGIELEKKSKYLVNRKQGYTQECRQMYLHKVLFTIRNKLQNQNNNQIFFFSQSKLQKSLFTLVHLSSTLV